MTVRDHLSDVAQDIHDATCPGHSTRRLDRTPDAVLERLLVDGLDAAEHHFREAIEGTEQDRAVAVHRAVRELARYRWGEKAGSPEEIRYRYKTRTTRIASREPAATPIADVLPPQPGPASARVLALKAAHTQAELGERERQVREQARRLRDRERARREWAALEAERRRERSRWSRLGGLMGGGR